MNDESSEHSHSAALAISLGLAETAEQAEPIGDLLGIAAPPVDRRPQHRCVDRAGADGVDPNPVGA